MRRGLVLSAIKQALIFSVLVGLTWSLRAAHTAAMVADCTPPFPPHSPPHGPPHGHVPRPFGPRFFHDLFGPHAGHPVFDPRDGPRSFRADASVSTPFALDAPFDGPIDGPDSPTGAGGRGPRHKPCKHKRGRKEGGMSTTSTSTRRGGTGTTQRSRTTTTTSTITRG